MQAGSLSAAGHVSRWTVTVTVDGVARPVVSVDLGREISHDLPTSVAGGTGIEAASGTIMWAEPDTVTSRPSFPLRRVGNWPPRAGSRVEVWVSDPDTSWKVFTGRIDVTTGKPGDGDLRSKIVDDFDRLRALVSLPAIAATMPADVSDGIARAPVPVGLEPWWAAYRALDASGFGIAKGQMGGHPILAASFQGSIYPTLGGILGLSNSAPNMLSWADGYQHLTTGTKVQYAPAAVDRPTGSSIRVFIRRNYNSNASVTLILSDGTRWRVQFSTAPVGDATSINVYTGDPSTNLVYTQELAGSAMDRAPWVDVLLVAGSSEVRVANTSGVGNGAGSTGVMSQTMRHADVVSAEVEGAAVDVLLSYDSIANWSLYRGPSTAVPVNAWGRGIAGGMSASRVVEDEPAIDVLSQVADATLTGMWIDEAGRFQWAPSNMLGAGASVKTVSTSQDIFELGWEESLQAARSDVLVQYEAAAVTLRTRPTLQVWPPVRSTGASLGPRESQEDFIEPPSDEEWIDPDLNLRLVSDAAIGESSFIQGSWWGGVYLASGDDTSTTDDDIYEWAPERFLGMRLDTLGADTWMLTQTCLTATTTVHLETEGTNSVLPRRWREHPLPILRARGRVRFADQAVVGETKGPSWAPSLTLQARHWVNGAAARTIADWLAARVTQNLIVLRDLDVEYDPRLQLGDRITVTSDYLLGFTADVVIVGKHESLGSDPQMRLDVRVVRASTTYVTLAELEEHYRGRNLAALESAWTARTLNSFENAPLSE